MSNTENNIEFKDFAQHGVNGVSIYKDGVTRVVYPTTIYDDWLAVEHGGWKMLLRPLSDLTKNESYNEDNTTVRDYLNSREVSEILEESKKRGRVDYTSHYLYRRLLGWHFDISNQIGKTAIDIKTLKD